MPAGAAPVGETDRPAAKSHNGIRRAKPIAGRAALINRDATTSVRPTAAPPGASTTGSPKKREGKQRDQCQAI